MSTACGIGALILGGLSFVASCIRAYLNQADRSNELEKCSIGWFILAALCFR